MANIGYIHEMTKKNVRSALRQGEIGLKPKGMIL